MTIPPTTVLHCPAKINLALSVGSPDGSGYHPIASWMVAVGLHDELHVQPRTPNAPSIYHIDWAADAPQPGAIDWSLRDDLAVRAHRLVEQHVGRSLPIRMRLIKRIPAGAGLAGGSSDAAGMLRALDAAFDLRLDPAVQRDLAMQLGSDPAFFLGPGSALVTGRGEHLEPLEPKNPIHLVLILPPLHCPTGAVYRAFDEATAGDRTPRPVDVPRVRSLAASDPLPAAALFNDLAEPAMAVTPDLRPLGEQLAAAADRPIHITGSGAGLFALADDAAHATRLAAALRGAVDASNGRIAVIPTHTVAIAPARPIE